MYILFCLKCNPHAIPHADIKGAWRRPYWPCMTIQHTQPPLVAFASLKLLDELHLMPKNIGQSSQPEVVLPKMWMRNFPCVLHIIRPIPHALPVINSRSENRSHRFSQLNRDSLNHNRPQQLCEPISNIKRRRWHGTLVKAKTLAQNR